MPQVTATPRALAARTRSNAAAVVTWRKWSRAPVISASAMSRATASASASAGALGRPSARRHLARRWRRPARQGRHPRHASTTDEVEHRRIGQQRAASRRCRRSTRRPVATARAPASRISAISASSRAFQADRWRRRAGGPRSRACRSTRRSGRRAGWSSSGDWSGISAARVMPPKWNAGLSIANTPRSTRPGATMHAARVDDVVVVGHGEVAHRGDRVAVDAADAAGHDACGRRPAGRR